jgi:hypothetical protein
MDSEWKDLQTNNFSERLSESACHKLWHGKTELEIYVIAFFK